jgi:hypothetical protein
VVFLSWGLSHLLGLRALFEGLEPDLGGREGGGSSIDQSVLKKSHVKRSKKRKKKIIFDVKDS